jgi:hypothetical protein
MVAQVMNDAASLTRKSTTEARLLRLAGAAQGAGCRGVLRRLRHTRTHRCVDQTRRDGVHADAVTSEPGPEAPGQYLLNPN